MLGAVKAFIDLKIKTHIHLMGVGGAGMSGLALLLNAMGHEVSGCDMVNTFYLDRVRKSGVGVAMGHHKEHLDRFRPGLIIHTSAIAQDHPELAEAKRRGIPVARRAEILSLIFNNKKGVGVAGTHGKTTTSSMISLIAERANYDPSVAIGGEISDIGCNAKLGAGEYMIAELDESDGSFELFSPHVAVVTNIDWDHIDHYPSIECVTEAFNRFMSGRKLGAPLVVCAEDPGIQRLLSSNRHENVVTYGLGLGWTWGASDLRHRPGGGVTFAVHKNGVEFGEVCLKVSGEHNVLNALAALAASDGMGISFEVASESLGIFRGAKRRLQFVGERRDIILYDDYGHHPKEVSAALAALGKMFPERRLHVVFQPHRYTRTEALFADFASALLHVGKVYLLPIYAADEQPIRGISSCLIADAMSELGRTDVMVCEDFNQASDLVCKNVRAGDMILTIGAGNVNTLGERILDALDRHSSPAGGFVCSV